MTILWFLNVVLLSRLGYLVRDDALPRSLIAAAAALQLAALGVYEPSPRLAVLAGVIVAVNGFLWWRERGDRPLTGARALGFAILVVSACLLLPGAAFQPWALALAARLGALLPSPLPNGEALALISFGALLLVNEVNLLIRYGFQRLRLEPKLADTGDAEAATDQRQYNAGRVIGILERWLIFAVLLARADFAVIAFIIAAKGFARFKQLDRREFAEYVLIGTLASTLAAVLTALAVGARLPH